MSTGHILYIIFSPIVVGLICFGGSFIKKQKHKDMFLAFWALTCFFIHISCCFTTMLANKESGGHWGYIYDNQLLPIYFCNFIMYLQLVVSFWFDKKTKLFHNIATFTAYGGVFGALITLFATDPGFPTWYLMQSAFSHSCLLITSIYLFVGKYVKISVYNVIPYSLGLLTSGGVGGLVMLIYYLNGLPIPNAMYLLHGPDELPAFHGGYFAIVMLVLIFIFTALFEQFSRKEEDRWYKSTSDIKLYF